jgi:hypothetical protein
MEDVSSEFYDGSGAKDSEDSVGNDLDVFDVQKKITAGPRVGCYKKIYFDWNALLLLLGYKKKDQEPLPPGEHRRIRGRRLFDLRRWKEPRRTESYLLLEAVFAQCQRNSQSRQRALLRLS